MGSFAKNFGINQNQTIKGIVDNIKKDILELRAKVKPKLTMVSGREIANLIGNRFGVIEEFLTIEMDREYSVIEKDEFDKLLATDIATMNKYIRDLYDCDNYSHVFKDWMDLLYLYSGIGVAYGELYISGIFVGLHSYNLVAVMDNGKLDLLLYEPQAHAYTEAVQNAKIGNLMYVTRSSEWY